MHEKVAEVGEKGENWDVVYLYIYMYIYVCIYTYIYANIQINIVIDAEAHIVIIIEYRQY